jgi:hypothetical protein
MVARAGITGSARTQRRVMHEPEGGGSWGNHGFPHAQSRATRAEGRVVARFNAPRATRVEARVDGTPAEVNHRAVAFVREEWRVVDRWWTEEPVSRRYFELVLESGENTVVFHDGASGGWYTQRGA